jgi:hypothetical protein
MILSYIAAASFCLSDISSMIMNKLKLNAVAGALLRRV